MPVTLMDSVYSVTWGWSQRPRGKKRRRGAGEAHDACEELILSSLSARNVHFDIWQNQYNIVKFKNKIKLKKGNVRVILIFIWHVFGGKAQESHFLASGWSET